MANKVEFKTVEIGCSVMPIRFDETKCINCNQCVNTCQVDVLIPGEKHPIVCYPGECYYCGSCVMSCANNAITLRHPIMNETKFVNVVR